MQIQINNLDGSMKSIEPQNDMEDKQMLIDHAVNVSTGYMVIIGDGLDLSPTQETLNIIARDGELLWQNVLDPA